MTLDSSQVKEIERQRFQLSFLDLYDAIDPATVNEVIKEKESSVTKFMFKVD